MHFILPKKICKSIEHLLRNFLWTGTEVKSSTHKVSWEDICCPKKEGGLGIRRVEDWNKAAMMRHLWAICSNHNSIWVQWCHKFLIKSKCFWTLSIPSVCSWTWRKILKLRDKARPFLKHNIGNGNTTFLWLDSWHPNGPLVERYGGRIAYDAGLNIFSKVSAVIRNGVWAWPFPSTWELREVTHLLTQVQPDVSRQDRVEWIISSTKKYTASDTWNSIRARKNLVTWHKLLWFPKHIPKHSFILWLAIRGRLTTRDKLMEWGKIVQATCLLCDLDDENLGHLFFSCPYSRHIWRQICSLCDISKPQHTWTNEILWIIGKFSSKSFGNIIRKLAWAAMVYHIWIERNNRVFRGQKKSPDQLIQEIKHELRLKATQFCGIKRSDLNRLICSNWDIPFSIMRT